jgi:hypothetical protein
MQSQEGPRSAAALGHQRDAPTPRGHRPTGISLQGDIGPLKRARWRPDAIRHPDGKEEHSAELGVAVTLSCVSKPFWRPAQAGAASPRVRMPPKAARRHQLLEARLAACTRGVPVRALGSEVLLGSPAMALAGVSGGCVSRRRVLALTWPPGIRWPRRDVRHNRIGLGTPCGTSRASMGHGSQDPNTPTINVADAT